LKLVTTSAQTNELIRRSIVAHENENFEDEIDLLKSAIANRESDVSCEEMRLIRMAYWQMSNRATNANRDRRRFYCRDGLDLCDRICIDRRTEDINSEWLFHYRRMIYFCHYHLSLTMTDDDDDNERKLIWPKLKTKYMQLFDICARLWPMANDPKRFQIVNDFAHLCCFYRQFVDDESIQLLKKFVANAKRACGKHLEQHEVFELIKITEKCIEKCGK
jgi:hypothetical protein